LKPVASLSRSLVEEHVERAEVSSAPNKPRIKRHQRVGKPENSAEAAARLRRQIALTIRNPIHLQLIMGFFVISLQYEAKKQFLQNGAHGGAVKSRLPGRYLCAYFAAVLPNKANF
jgi:hypothetical protein